jgi:Arc/MetJ family transcription regulator
MDDLDALAPHFRRVMERWPEAPTLSNHYKAVAENHAGSGHGLIGTVKSFIECVCLTILGEFGKPMPSSDPSTTELLVEALRVLGLQNSRGASKIDKLLSAHNRMADALSEMRNENDPVAHGKDGFLDTLTINERRAFLVTADTILALLLFAHDGTEPDLHYTREPYERFAHLHERVDRAVTVEAAIEDDGEHQVVVVTLRTVGLSEGIQLRFEPSRLLYATDREAYVELLTSSLAPPGAPLEQADIAQASDAAVEPIRASEPAPPAAEIVPSYEGALSPLKESLDQYLESLGLSAVGTAPVGVRLTDSLLATAERSMGLDWTAREALQAAMKVGLRRTLVQFGVDHDRAERGAEHLVSWLKIQAVGLGSAGPA